MSLEELEDIEWVKQHLWEVVKAYNIIDRQMTTIKTAYNEKLKQLK